MTSNALPPNAPRLYGKPSKPTESYETPFTVSYTEVILARARNRLNATHHFNSYLEFVIDEIEWFKTHQTEGYDQNKPWVKQYNIDFSFNPSIQYPPFDISQYTANLYKKVKKNTSPRGKNSTSVISKFNIKPFIQAIYSDYRVETPQHIHIELETFLLAILERVAIGAKKYATKESDSQGTYLVLSHEAFNKSIKDLNLQKYHLPTPPILPLQNQPQPKKKFTLRDRSIPLSELFL